MKDNEKELMILEYNPRQEVGHISFIWDRSLIIHSNWKKLGMFYGTMFSAAKELDRRIERYKKKNN